MIRQFIHDKVLLLNASTLTLSFMNIQEVLKIILLLVSIFYTLYRILGEYRKQNKEKG